MKKKLHLNFAQKFFNTNSKLNDNILLSNLGSWDSLKQIELVIQLEKVLEMVKKEMDYMNSSLRTKIK